MNESSPNRNRRRTSSRSSRREERSQQITAQLPPAIQAIGPLDIMTTEVRDLIIHQAETVLEEIGVDFVDTPESSKLWKAAGANVSIQSDNDKGLRERIRIPRGLTKKLMRTLPQAFDQAARNPARSVHIGDKSTVFAPVYGPPFVNDLDKGRRYGTLEDFQNFVKLVYQLPTLHHSGGTVCEPVDVPVNKRHLDMVYAHFKYSDKPIMGSVTAPWRATDTVEMARLVFGEQFVDQNACLLSLININSPLSFDANMLQTLEVYASANQAVIVSPFIISGAMAPSTPAGVMVQATAETLVGLAHTQLIRPGAPAIFGTFCAAMSMQSGAPTFGMPEPSLVTYGMAQIARHLKVPFRSGGALNASKVPDSQAAYESLSSLFCTVTSGVHFVLHAAGWLEGGLVSSYEKLLMDADQLGAMQKMMRGLETDANGLAMDAIRDIGPGGHHLGTAHTQSNYLNAFYRAHLHDSGSYEQWLSEGSTDMAQRANTRWKSMLASYEPPAIDESVDDALKAYVAKRKNELPDSPY